MKFSDFYLMSLLFSVMLGGNTLLFSEENDTDDAFQLDPPPMMESEPEIKPEKETVPAPKHGAESENAVKGSELKDFPIISDDTQHILPQKTPRIPEKSEEDVPPEINFEEDFDFKETPDSEKKSDSEKDFDFEKKSDSETDSSSGEISDTALNVETEKEVPPEMEFNDTDSEENLQKKNSEPSEISGKSDSETVHVFTPEEKALQQKILHTLKVYDRISLCTEENRPLDVISYIIPYGCDASIFFGCREAEERVNAIGALCWNVPMGNESAFTDSTSRLMPRLGYGIQQYSGQLLAALAIARVPRDYRFPAGWASAEENTENAADEESGENNESAGNTENIKDAEKMQDQKSPDFSGKRKTPRGKKRFEVKNLVEFEQKNCREGNDLSLTLIALSYYLPTDAKWENNEGEIWTLERIVKNELERPMSAGKSAATNQLLGLLCAIRCRNIRTKNTPLTGEYARAEEYMQKFRVFTLDLQNELDVWHPDFFQKKGSTPTQPTEMLIASGHILRWLVTATPKKELSDPRIFRAVSRVNALLEYELTKWNPSSASSTEIEGVMTALHALVVYEKRFFK